MLLDSLLEADPALHRLETDVFVRLELLELGFDQIVGIPQAPIEMLGGGTQVFDAPVRVDHHDPVVDTEAAQTLAAAQPPGDDQLTCARNRAPKPCVAFALAFV